MLDKVALTPLLDSLLAEHLGYVLAPWPQPLWDRLSQLAAIHGQAPVLLLSRALRGERALTQALISAATVTHSAFFRHPAQFARLERELRQRRSAQSSLLCVGCARGEEVYSLALSAERAGADVRIRAVDVNADALEHAKAGRYDARTARNLPDVDAVSGWTAPARLRERVRFEHGSLSSVIARAGQSYDYIFCRNVFIYFDNEGAYEAMQTFARMLKPRGALIVAPTESLGVLPPELERGSPPGWLERSTRPVMLHPPLASLRPSVAFSLRPPPPVATAPVAVRASLPPDSLGLALGQGGGEPALRKWLDYHPNDATAWFLLGEALMHRGQSAQAGVAFDQAVAHAAHSTHVDAETLATAAERRARAARGGAT